jgi:hypothetical protein
LKVLSKFEVENFLEAHAKIGHDRIQHEGLRPFFTGPEVGEIVLEYPPKLERLSYFARVIPTIGYEPAHFSGALLWFTTWGVWNESDEGVFYRIVEGLRAGAGQSASFEAFPGQLYRADEFTESIGMLLLPMIIGWDAYYFPTWSWGVPEFFLQVSHDSYVVIVTRTKKFYETALSALKEAHIEAKSPG